MKFEDVKRALLACCDDLIAREIELSELDALVGDGDHGVTIRKGYMTVKKAIEEEEAATISDLFFNAGMALADTAGGAIGPILASMFIGFSTSTKGEEDLGVKELAEMFAGGLAGVQNLGGAKPGDCTMVDSLYPFVESLKAAETADVKEALEAAAEKALEGSDSTKMMQARLGRARNLRERSIGFIDAGSRSMYYFLKAFADNA